MLVLKGKRHQASHDLTGQSTLDRLSPQKMKKIKGSFQSSGTLMLSKSATSGMLNVYDKSTSKGHKISSKGRKISSKGRKNSIMVQEVSISRDSKMMESINLSGDATHPLDDTQFLNDKGQQITKESIIDVKNSARDDSMMQMSVEILKTPREKMLRSDFFMARQSKIEYRPELIYQRSNSARRHRQYPNK